MGRGMTRNEFHAALRDRIHHRVVMPGPLGKVLSEAADLFAEVTQQTDQAHVFEYRMQFGYVCQRCKQLLIGLNPNISCKGRPWTIDEVREENEKSPFNVAINPNSFDDK